MTASPLAVRRRAAALRSLEQSDRLEAGVAALALPISARQVRSYAPAVTLLAVVIAFTLLEAIGVLALVVAGAATVAALHRTAPRRRAAASERALPALLDAVARHLRAGGSLAQAITAAAPPAAVPDLQRSWTRLADLIGLLGVTAALEDWASDHGRRSVRDDDAVPLDRMAGRSGWGAHTRPAAGATVGRRDGTSRSVHLAAAALALASTTGGSPARAIDGVAATLRSRLAVAEELRALSSQARTSAVVIALAPLAFGLLAGASDQRTRDFLASPAGLVLLAAGLTLDAIGAYWMSHLCRPPTAAT